MALYSAEGPPQPPSIQQMPAQEESADVKAKNLLLSYINNISQHWTEYNFTTSGLNELNQFLLRAQNPLLPWNTY
jgi:hypothetical protein